MICHHYKCLFVHIPKTAGQSIEHAFLEARGLSWRTRAPLLLGPNPDPRLGPPRLAHLKIREYLDYNYLSPELFDQYFKFSIVRNPWDRVVSIYKFSGYNIPFKSFLFKVFLKKMWNREYWFVGPQHEFVCDSSGGICVDYIGRFENLEQDFRKISNIVGVNCSIKHINRSQDKNEFYARGRQLVDGVKHMDIHMMASIFIKKKYMANYLMYYDAESIELVSDLYKRDVEIFGYESPS